MSDRHAHVSATELLRAFDLGMAMFDQAVDRIGAGQWDRPTPCSRWSVRDVLNHMTAEHLWAPPMLAGATLKEVGDRFDGDQLGTDPHATWRHVSVTSRQAFHAPEALDGQVHTTRGRIPTEEYAWQMITDLVLHAWDIATGIGAPVQFDAWLAATVYERIEPDIDNWRLSGSFAAAVAVPPDSDMSTRLIALSGRDPAR